TFTYEGRNLLASTRNPLGQMKSYFYDAARQPDHVVDAKGQRIEFTYDDAGQITRKALKDALGSTTDTVNYTYDPLGSLATATDDDSGLSFTYDAIGHLSMASTIAGPAQPATDVRYGFDKAGNRTRLTDPYHNLVTYAYDEENRLTTLSNNNGA